jgi:uncharacterized lipoprotein NlpE involved in copper resistance
MRRTVAVAAVFLVLAGCSSSKNGKGTVSGKVTYKDQPVNNASILLYSTTTAGEAVVIPTAADGTFRAADIPAGDYKVAIQGSPASSGPDTKGMTKEQLEKMKDSLAKMKSEATIKFPQKYNNKDTSGLTLTVKGKTDKDFVLTD